MKTVFKIIAALCLTYCGVCVFIYFDEGRSTRNAKVLKVELNGNSIVKSIITANAERKEIGIKSVWPTKDKYKTSNDYFAALLSKNVIGGISFATFAGAGIPKTGKLEQFRTDNHNIWNVVAGLDDTDADKLPFLFSRNFSITAEELMNADPNDTKTDWSHKITENVPGLKKRIVVVTKGAAVFSLSARYLAPANVLRGARYTNDIEILKAVE